MNDSRLNTGLRVLPAVVQPEVWYSYPDADMGLFPELFQNMGGDGIAPMADVSVALGTAMSGELASFYDSSNETPFFLVIGLVAIGVGALVLALSRPIRSLMSGVH